MSFPFTLGKDYHIHDSIENTDCRTGFGLKKLFIDVGFNHTMKSDAVILNSARPMNSRVGRYLMIALGWMCIAIGVVGVVVPGLPTTVFLLVAAWAFSRSSDRFQRWLLDHPHLGPPVADWRDRGAIPLKAKALAIVMMAASLSVIVFYVASDWRLPTVVGLVMAAAGAYVVTRPNA